MNFQPELLALMVILVFAVIFLLVFRAGRRQAAEKKHQALTLGYEEVTTRPSQLISRAESLFKRGENSSIHIDQVYSKREWGQEFFIFDVSDSNSDDSELGSEVFGVISDQLALPHFSLTTLPGFNSDSLIGGLMEGLLDKVLSVAEKYSGLKRIDLDDRPGFDEQVIIFGKDQAAVKDLMIRIDLGSITSIKTPLHITGMNDFLTVDFSQMGSYKDPELDLIAQHREFTRITRYFIN
jgi:hypothetical protein